MHGDLLAAALTAAQSAGVSVILRPRLRCGRDYRWLRSRDGRAQALVVDLRRTAEQVERTVTDQLLAELTPQPRLRVVRDGEREARRDDRGSVA